MSIKRTKGARDLLNVYYTVANGANDSRSREGGDPEIQFALSSLGSVENQSQLGGVLTPLRPGCSKALGCSRLPPNGRPYLGLHT